MAQHTNTSETQENAARCSALRKDGKPCRAFARVDGLCIAHCPQANEWRSAGGRGTRTSARMLRLLPDRLRPVFERLVSVYERLDAGDYDRQQAVAMAQVAGVLVRIVQAGELEERMREIERRLDEEGQRARTWAS